MTRELTRFGLVAAAALAAAGCDDLALGPQKAASAPAESPAVAFDPESVRGHAGETYADFVAAAGGATYSPEAIGLQAIDRTRVWRAMATAEGGSLVEGGGAQALVFRGCAETGCIDGAAVVAIDTATGAVFAGVRDAAGAEVLTPNERVEALLRLNSPSRRWDDPASASHSDPG